MPTPKSPCIQQEQRAKVCRMMVLVVLVAIALRLAVTPFNSIEGLMDPDHRYGWEQGNVAEAIVAGHGFCSPFVSTQVSAVMPPVFPLVVAGFYRVFGVHTGASIFAVHAFNCLVSALACIPIFLIAKRSFGRRVAWWAAWGWAFFPYGIYFAACWAWSTHLLLLGLCWLFYFAQQMEQSSRLGLWAAFGLLAGFAALCEPSVLTVVAFLMVLACFRLMREGKRWFVPGALACLVLVATVSPWMIRNAMVFHRFIPMRDSMGLELWLGNNGQSLRWVSDDLNPLHNLDERADYDQMGELAYMDHKAQQTRAYIHDHAAWYAGMCVRRAAYMWTGFWSFDRAYLAEEQMDLPNIPFATMLSLMAIAGIAAAWRVSRFDALRYGGILLVFPLMYYFSHPEPYHLRPLDPLVLIVGCHAIQMWRERSRERAALAAAETMVQEA